MPRISTCRPSIGPPSASCRSAEGSTTTYRTDAFGVIRPDGALEQTVSRHDAIGIPLTADQTQFKLRRSACAAGLGAKN